VTMTVGFVRSGPGPAGIRAPTLAGRNILAFDMKAPSLSLEASEPLSGIPPSWMGADSHACDDLARTNPTEHSPLPFANDGSFMQQFQQAERQQQMRDSNAESAAPNPDDQSYSELSSSGNEKSSGKAANAEKSAVDNKPKKSLLAAFSTKKKEVDLMQAYSHSIYTFLFSLIGKKKSTIWLTLSVMEHRPNRRLFLLNPRQRSKRRKGSATNTSRRWRSIGTRPVARWAASTRSSSEACPQSSSRCALNPPIKYLTSVREMLHCPHVSALDQGYCASLPSPLCPRVQANNWSVPLVCGRVAACDC
jgi:hypothetical protein